MGKLVRAITTSGVIRAFAINGTDMVEKARQIHKTTPTTTAALGRTLIAASMMGNMLKSEKENLTLRIHGNGPAGKVIACSDLSGSVRGYIENPGIDLPTRTDGKIDVGGAVGKDGFVQVIKDLGMKEPYNGQTPIITGEIAEDITNYFAVSEQTGTVCALGVLIDKDTSVKAAGGYIIQLLPNVYDDEITKLESNMRDIESVTEMIEKGMTPIQMLEKALEGFEVESLGEYDADYVCKCGTERVEKALASLGKGELFKLAVELHDKGEDHIEIKCEFCEKKYSAWFDNGKIIVNQT